MATEDRILEETPELARLLDIDELVQSAGWRYMKQRFEKYDPFSPLMRQILSGEPVDQRKIDFMRGYRAAIRDFFKFPDRFVKEAERAAEETYMRIEEGLSDEPGEEPYQ